VDADSGIVQSIIGALPLGIWMPQIAIGIDANTAFWPHLVLLKHNDEKILVHSFMTRKYWTCTGFP